MKHIFKTLLGLVLVVFVLAGCSNPAGPETPEVIEPPVVEVPEENVKLVKVEFKLGSCPNITCDKKTFLRNYPRYFLDLRSKSLDDGNYDYDYVYSYPDGYDRSSYIELMNDSERFEKFCNDAFEHIFGTKYYKEGDTIGLTQWTSKAVDLVNTCDGVYITTTRLYFLAEDVGNNKQDVKVKSLDKIEVKNEDMVIYVYWAMEEDWF